MHNVVLLIKYICLIVDVSEGYDVDKAGASEKCFFLPVLVVLQNGFMFQPTFCNLSLLDFWY